MKIFIPFEVKDIGGPSSFVTKFKLGLERRGHEVTFQETPDYDILFLIVQAPFKYILKAKRRKIPIVQRLDGVFYWSVSKWMFPLLNLKATLIRHLFTDYTVYQSDYSKYCADRFLGKKLHDQYSIIYNGIDTDLFSPEGSSQKLRDFPEQALFFTASEFRRTDQILPLLKALTLLEASRPGSFKLLIAGHFIRELEGFETKLREYPWIHFLGKIENASLPEYERGADVFLFSHLNPPCPNNIIEALACGLPICGVADGAMPELVEDGLEGLLLPTKGNGFWRKRTYDTPLFVENLRGIVENRALFSKQARLKALQKFSLEKMINQYIDFLIKIKS